MAKTTLVRYEGIWDYDKTTRIFKTIGNPKIRSLWVEGFEDGIATINPAGGSEIHDFAEAVAGCFSDNSNFGTLLLRAYNCDKNATFTGIKFEFNGVTLIVTKENADAERIYQEWDAAFEANVEKAHREREAWLKTPEGQEYLAQQEAEKLRKEAIEADVLHLDETVEMEFNGEEGKKTWDHLVEINSKDPYGNGVVKYARRWAKYMQKLIAEGKTVAEIADEASNYCDIEGITGFMYGCAVDALSRCWKWGEELRKWHNKRYGHEGDGVVNPAVLTVSVD
jgi:hypothetical protein